MKNKGFDIGSVQLYWTEHLIIYKLITSQSTTSARETHHITMETG
jgi:hypothetical protein